MPDTPVGGLDSGPVPPAADRPRMSTPSPEELRHQLTQLVQVKTGSQIVDLDVEVRDSEVILTGHAPSYRAKQLATHAAIDQVGSRRLMNAIDVR